MDFGIFSIAPRELQDVFNRLIEDAEGSGRYAGSEYVKGQQTGKILSAYRAIIGNHGIADGTMYALTHFLSRKLVYGKIIDAFREGFAQTAGTDLKSAIERLEKQLRRCER